MNAQPLTITTPPTGPGPAREAPASLAGPEPFFLPTRRPTRRAECFQGPRPCPWVGCRWHLAWEVTAVRKLLLAGDTTEAAQAITELRHTCVMDLADTEPGMAEIGRALGVSHQRVDQMINKIIAKLGSRGRRRPLEEFGE
ncbi:MAG: hypothetical protein KQJ78_19545 [Deltaproteobacteria bacterium]|nr:hypothetical protein [Deltaproteobacteria bacterium]